jgi:diguanylate cyclase (GGDEF)-like protein
MADAKPDILALFNESLGRESDEERSRYLDEACQDDPQVRGRVEALLRAHSDAGNFLSGQLSAVPPIIDQFLAEQPDTMIGRYKLLQEIGKGGMGVVYMAEQREPIRRKVALKIIKLGMDTKEVVARFEAERQALAMMDHPNIAKVHDGGATESGRPYFVMELVHGIRLTKYCDENQLTTRERLELFVQVCQAVQHAHQKGIIHRDIKPSNVMVTLHDHLAVPKIIDFGIAKATNGQLTEKTLFTGAVFIDTRLNIIKWSRASRDLTGIDTASIERRQWDPGLLGLRDENYKLITRDKCPVIAAVTEGTNSSGRYMLVSSNHEKIAIDLCASPVLGPDGEVRGATLVLHDASSHVNLEERLQSLNKKASQDGLTGVANRAEFDRTHADWFQMHLERGLPYSLIICDLDFFKRINDTYGHQAGDEGLISFGALLRKYCRSNDLVARYGGEEFVILCADCDSEAAEARAENIREASASQPHHMLNGTRLTASFGVTGLQGGDTAETMLRRADRALLQAKADGRNTVVHLGRPTAGRRDQKKHRLDWLCWWKDKPGKHLLQRCLLTPVPIELAMEKLRGFVVNHAAQILEADEDQLVLQIDGKQLPLMRRSGDRPTSLLVELHLEETRQASEDRPGCRDLRTAVRVTIRPKRQRDRRRSDADERARQLLASLKSYLMAQD